MITSLEDLFVSLGTDAAMITAIAAGYGILSRRLHQVARDEITPAIRSAIEAEHGHTGQMPQEQFEELLSEMAGVRQAQADLRTDLDGVSRRLDSLRTMFYSHLDRSHPR